VAPQEETGNKGKETRRGGRDPRPGDQLVARRMTHKEKKLTLQKKSDVKLRQRRRKN